MIINARREKEIQMSEAFITMAFITFSGGLQDAYSFLVRGEVFANAQTGNIVLFSVNMVNGNLLMALRYLFPVLAFALGIFLTDLFKAKFKNSAKIHWRQVILIFEIALLFIVAFFPNKYDTLANIIISFSCAMQVQAFRKIHGYSFASTMCIGNTRAGMEALCSYVRTRDKKYKEKAIHYFGVILLFALGAAFGGVFSKIFKNYTIMFSSGFLFISFLLMFKKNPVDMAENVMLENDTAS